MNKNITQQRGFGLIELILYLGITTIILSGISAFTILSMQSLAKGKIADNTLSQGDFAMSLILQRIRNSNGVNLPSAGANSASLIITSPTPSLNPTAFSLVAGQIIMQEGSAEAVALTPESVQITSLSFENLGQSPANASIRVTFTIQNLPTSNLSGYLSTTQTLRGSATIKRL